MYCTPGSWTPEYGSGGGIASHRHGRDWRQAEECVDCGVANEGQLAVFLAGVYWCSGASGRWTLIRLSCGRNGSRIQAFSSVIGAEHWQEGARREQPG